MTGTQAILDEGSLRDRLRAARATKQHEHIEQLELPKYGGQIVVRYRTLDFRERREIGLATESVEPVPVRELEAAAATLARSCVGVDAHLDGTVMPITHENAPVTMGLSLAAFLGLEGAETDPQAVFLIFGVGEEPLGELQVIRHVEELSKKQLAADEQIDGDLKGN